MTPHDMIAALNSVAEAPEGVERLREVVLQLAMRGRLVPQDPADEPASMLMERIAAEKARMVRDGEIRKQEPPLPVREDEIPFAVPKAWCWTRFDDVADTRLGKMLDKARNQGPLRPYLRNANVQWFRFVLDDLRQLRIEDAQLSDCTVHDGDLVICEGGEPGRAAVCGPEVDGMVIQKALHRARPWCGISARFLAYLLRCDASSGRLAEHFTGATIKHLTGKALAQCLVPLPPLAEQHRIVGRVDELMGLLGQLDSARTSRDATRAVVRDSVLAALREADGTEEVEAAWYRFAERMDDLVCDPADIAPVRQTILQLAVRGRLVPQELREGTGKSVIEDVHRERSRFVREGLLRGVSDKLPSGVDAPPFPIPATWAWAQAADICLVITDGDHQPPPQVEEGIPFVVIGNVSRGYIDLTDTRRVPQDYFNALEWTRKPGRGDLLYTITGSYGIVLEVGDVEPFCVQRHIGIIKTASCFENQYLAHVLRSAYAFSHATDVATGIAQKTVPLSGLRRLPVPVPPLAEQHRIVARVEELMGLLDRLEQRLAAARTAHIAFAAAAVQHLHA